jgi:hypothetical protein
VTGNASDGINATGGGCRISGNALRGNGTTYGGSGLNIDAESTYRDNTITNNITGAVTGGGVNMGDNYCAGTGVNLSSCP